MGRKARLKKERKQFKQEFGQVMPDEPMKFRGEAGNVTPAMRDFADSFFADMSGELEPLTDDLVAELVRNGWEEARVREAQAMGLSYSRKRNSFWQ